VRNPDILRLSLQHPLEYNLFLLKHQAVEGMKKGLDIGSRLAVAYSMFHGGTAIVQAKDLQSPPSHVGLPNANLSSTYAENLAAADLTLDHSQIDSPVEQGEVLLPSVIRIFSPEGRLSSLYYADFQANNQDSSVTESISEVQRLFSDYNRASGLNTSSYELVVVGELDNNNTIVQPPTPNGVPDKIPVYASVSGAGILFVPDASSSLGWEAYSTGTSEITAVAPNTQFFVAPSGEGGIRAYINVDAADHKPQAVAFGVPIPSSAENVIGAMEWKSMIHAYEPREEQVLQVRNGDLKGVVTRIGGKNVMLVTDLPYVTGLNGMDPEIMAWAITRKLGLSAHFNEAFEVRLLQKEPNQVYESNYGSQDGNIDYVYEDLPDRKVFTAYIDMRHFDSYVTWQRAHPNNPAIPYVIEYFLKDTIFATLRHGALTPQQKQALTDIYDNFGRNNEEVIPIVNTIQLTVDAAYFK